MYADEEKVQKGLPCVVVFMILRAPLHVRKYTHTEGKDCREREGKAMSLQRIRGFYVCLLNFYDIQSCRQEKGDF